MTDFKAKMHQIRFRLGLRPRPRWGSLQRSPRLPSWIWGPTSKEREREGGEERGREEWEGEGRKGKRRGRKVYAYGAPPTSKSWLRHWLGLLKRLAYEILGRVDFSYFLFLYFSSHIAPHCLYQ